ncbi:MAG: four helix bundle protein [Verrucomicrobia bacterium]|nr:four helix bundle protein [Verrucomicrobiota bacterium]
MKTNPDAKPQDIRERAFEFAVRVVRLCRMLDSKPSADRMLARQLLRSATSIGANLEEAQAAASKADFINKNTIALKEARETHYWLRLFIATETARAPELTALTDEAQQLKRILAAIIISAKKGPTQ